MTAKRLTKEDIRNTTGILNPLGHVVLAFKDDAVTAEAVAALRAAGSAEEDILVYRQRKPRPGCASACRPLARRLASATRSP